MAIPVRVAFAKLCRETRLELDITQRELAAAVGVTRGYIAGIETGRANPTLAMASRIADALGIELELTASRPRLVGGPRQRDLVHARCSGYADRRLRHADWLTAREVEVVRGQIRGWIDLLAFDPRTGRLLVVEIKTRIDDLGAIERQLGWYERAAWEQAALLGWRVRRVTPCLLVLASDEVDRQIRLNRDIVDRAFPMRSEALLQIVNRQPHGGATGWALAMIDPASRRRGWLIRTRIDGRRSAGPYLDYADAARRLGG